MNINVVRDSYPHLFDIQQEIDKIAEGTGYGDVTLVVSIQNHKVKKLELVGSQTKIYA